MEFSVLLRLAILMNLTYISFCAINIQGKELNIGDFVLRKKGLISSHLGFVHPLQDVALHQCLPSSSVCCLPNPGGSLLLCYVILPSSAWSSSRPLPSPWLPRKKKKKKGQKRKKKKEKNTTKKKKSGWLAIAILTTCVYEEARSTMLPLFTLGNMCCYV